MSTAPIWIPIFRELFEKYPELKLPITLIVLTAFVVMLIATGLARDIVTWMSGSSEFKENGESQGMEEKAND